MNLPLPKALAVRVAEGQPVIPDVMAASTPARFRGKLKIDATRCPDGCAVCVEVCPTQAISTNPLTIDLGSCVFCPLCVEACPEGTITYTNDYRIAATSRQGLRLGEVPDVTPEACSEEIYRLFGRSLKLRSVSAGGCNGCELELNALGNVNFDMGRFGIEFVASARQVMVNMPAPVLGVFFLRQPIDMNALDRQPVHTLFVLLSVAPKQHLELLARLAFLFRHREFITLLSQRPKPETIVEWICSHLPK
jgi:ferredoxin